MTSKKKPSKASSKKAAPAKDTTAKGAIKPASPAPAVVKEAVKETVTVTMAPVAETPVAAPVAQAPVAEAPAAKPVLTIGMFQKRLHERGYYHGMWDGQYGPMTKQAVARFQHDQGLHPDGEPTDQTLAALGF